MNGDSLAEGTRPYIPKELRGLAGAAVDLGQPPRVRGRRRHAAFGRALPRVIHVSLGTNDDPGQVDAFREAIREVMDVAVARRCVVWANIVRPP